MSSALHYLCPSHPTSSSFQSRFSYGVRTSIVYYLAVKSPFAPLAKPLSSLTASSVPCYRFWPLTLIRAERPCGVPKGRCRRTHLFAADNRPVPMAFVIAALLLPVRRDASPRVITMGSPDAHLSINLHGKPVNLGSAKAGRNHIHRKRANKKAGTMPGQFPRKALSRFAVRRPWHRRPGDFDPNLGK
jgi:hypothetical protein